MQYLCLFIGLFCGLILFWGVGYAFLFLCMFQNLLPKAGHFWWRISPLWILIAPPMLVVVVCLFIYVLVTWLDAFSKVYFPRSMQSLTSLLRKLNRGAHPVFPSTRDNCGFILFPCILPWSPLVGLSLLVCHATLNFPELLANYSFVFNSCYIVWANGKSGPFAGSSCFSKFLFVEYSKK